MSRSRSNSNGDFASSLFPGGIPPPPPPPIPHPTGRLRRHRKGKKKLVADKRFGHTNPPKPTTTTHALNAAPSPKPTTTWSAARRTAKAPLIHDQAAEAPKDERFDLDRKDLEARLRKLLVADDDEDEEVEEDLPPRLNAFAVVKKTAGSKAANKQRTQDTSYRPPSKLDEPESESEEGGSEWDVVPGDLPAFSHSQISPVTKVLPPRPPLQPLHVPQPPPPPPIPNKPNPKSKLKRKRTEDPTYWPSKDNQEESSFDDSDSDDESDKKGVKEALKQKEIKLGNIKTDKNVGKRVLAERQQPQPQEKSPEHDTRTWKNMMLLLTPKEGHSSGEDEKKRKKREKKPLLNKKRGKGRNVWTSLRMAKASVLAKGESLSSRRKTRPSL